MSIPMQAVLAAEDGLLNGKAALIVVGAVVVIVLVVSFVRFLMDPNTYR